MEDTLKDFWATRPRRPRRGRKVAGVAAAIGDRYRIDPVIVRVAFAVSAFFGGAGVALYLLGWLFFAEEGDEASAGEALLGKGRSSVSTHLAVVLAIALIPAVSWFLDRDFTGFVGAAAALGLLFLLHRNRGHLGPVRTYEPTATDNHPQPARRPATGEQQAGVDQSDQPRQPPAWDPLGAAPFAWDLPEPGHAQQDDEPEPSPKRKSRVGALTLVAMLVACVATAVFGLSWADGGARPMIGVLLAVLGAGMVLGALRGGGRGLIWLAVPLAALGIATTALPDQARFNGFGEIHTRPTSLEQVQSEYRKSVGEVNVDLTGLPADGEVTTSVGADVGTVVVTVPRTADVRVSCTTGVGDVACLGSQESGPGAAVRDQTDLGDDGEGGLKINLTAAVSGPGSVEVRRG
ncbi:PspC domain-containing protein [Actinokineospora pegani]|uniref:PspC domain-containing protein n=1 Tax=Actinokineospora pegani TaxID=2654637 RepID=UPI001F1669EA|nr:PspC domain-containing protein [Actinokineospora pegani]